MSDLAKRLENLSPEKRELLLKKIRSQKLTTSNQEAKTTIVPIPRKRPIAVSFAQARLWFLDRLEGNATYNLPAALEIQGKLNTLALEKSLQEIIDRHEILRTEFAETDDSIVQIIHPKLAFELTIHDLESEQVSSIEQLAAEEAQKPFDLTKAPLMRATLLKLKPDFHILLLTMHHIISDGWSIDIFIREMGSLYQAFCKNQPSPLPKLAIQYADFSTWQRQWLQGANLEQQLQYWKQQLNHTPTLLDLPTDKPRPAFQSFRGQSETFTLTSSLKEKLELLSQQSGTTLFMTLLAAFSVLLSRYSRQEDIVIGSPIANRNRKEVEPLIGFFVNTLALRINLENNPNFKDILQQVKQTCLDAYAHQDLPFEKLVEELKLERSLSYHPLFQVMFVLQNAPSSQLKLENLTLCPLKIESGIAKFDLTLSIEETANDLIGHLEYNSDLFEPPTIHRLIGHFQTLLQDIVNFPERSIRGLDILTPDEKQQILVEWNQTQVEYPQERCVYQLFESQVERTPDAVAVVCGERQLTYRQLNEKANQLAYYLQSLGVQPETKVGIYLERSFNFLISILGVFKAGGVYVPLDPNYPSERLTYILSDAQVSIFITQEKLLSSLSDHSARVICLDRFSSPIEQQAIQNLTVPVQLNYLAYIIYTSGSTGTPKGVLVEQRGLLNLVHWHQNTFRVTATERVTQLATTAFDASVWELWPYLTSGGCIYIVEPQLLNSPIELQRWLIAREITITFLPTPLAEVLWQLEWPETTALRLMLIGGDQLRQYPPSSLPFQIINNYGPTENTVVTTSGIVNSQTTSLGTPSIGKAIPNTQVYILDPYLQLVPIGVPGELHITGMQLARGYLNRPELTAEKFIPNPFNHSKFKTQNSKLYKTGDLVRYLNDGDIEFLGRIDNQVKIRGYRIELGEIEAIVSQHPQVREAVIIVRETPAGEKQLVAYLVADSVAVGEIRQFLQERLPTYMIPSSFVFLKSLPMTPNGKIDRKALPQSQTRETHYQQVLPRNPIEELLALIWSDILKIEKIRVGDNFFELGGHSLLATQVVSRIRQNFNIELSIRSLFEHPTLEQLAQHFEQTRRQKRQLPIIASIERNQDLPLSFAQSRLWFLDQLEGFSDTYNIPIALKLVGDLNRQALEISWQEIVRRHEVLRTNFVTHHGIPVQIIHPVSRCSIDDIDLSHLSQTEQTQQISQIITTEATKPFNLGQDSLGRVSLIILDQKSYILSIVLHHIIADGWSMGVLVRELSTLYQAFNNHQPSPLSELSIQYADFAHWQRQILQGDYYQQQLEYWRQQLADSPSALNLPTDKPRPPVQSFRGQNYPLSFDNPQQLKALSQQYGVTPFMLLLATFAVLLARYSNQNDLIVGSPIANRNRAEIEALIGFFVNILPLRINLEGNPSFADLLKQVRQTCLDAYAHQDIPFEKLVSELHSDRNLSQNPLFQVMFVLQNAPLGELNLGQIELSPLDVATERAKFDLTLSVEETPNQLIGVWEYNSDLFDRTTIERLNRHFLHLLRAILEDPTQPIRNLPLLTHPESQQILLEWNQTQVEYPQDQCIYQLFESQVEKTPDAIAVIFELQQLTYHQLNQKANQLAHHLRSLGVVPDTIIGLCVERSLEMVIGLWGILKAGAAYLPLDPDYPRPRLDYMLSDSQVSIVLTQEHLLPQVSDPQRLTLCLDKDWPDGESANPSTQVRLEDLGYLIYTSGSTGQPKGVAMPQRALVNLIEWQRWSSPRSDATTLQFAPLSFDVSFQEIATTLCAGGKLILIDNERRRDFFALWQLIEQKKIERVFLPFIALQQLAEAVQERIPNSLQEIVTAGEQLQITPAIATLLERLPHCVLQNQYGPSESHVVSALSLTHETALQSTLPPIGRPIANTQLYILDSYLQPVPIGVVGELYIGGVQLATGYHRRPELTAEKFIPNPFNHSKFKTQNSKLYKTGDLARYLADGNIEFLGRIDHQVKIRGYRIELGEIEVILAQHPQIQEVVVVAREDRQGRQLVAYLVTDSTELPLNDIREFLQARLPAYMVPSIFVVLESLPLTPSGKVDRQALPQPEIGKNQQQILPRTPIEELLALIWTDILKIENLAIEDNFFELGGHSLLATQVISRIRQSFNIELPVRSLFEHPTIEQLAQHIVGQRQERQLPAIEPIERNQDLPLSFAQSRLWFLDQLEGQSSTYNIPIALQIEGQLNRQALENSWRELVRRHEVFRTNFITHQGIPVQIIHADVVIPIKDIVLSHLSQTEQTQQISRLITTEAAKPFHLEQDSLGRVSLITLAEQSFILLITLHHIISDGWSMGVLVRELSTLYQAFSQNQPSPLAELPIQYADFAHWQRQVLQGDYLQQQLEYWKKQLTDRSPSLNLPTDQPRPVRQSFRGGNYGFAMDSQQQQQIKAFTQKSGVTLFMFLLTAFGVLLSRYSRQEDIIIGSPIANRNRREVDALIGFFVNTLPLRINLENNPSFAELLKQVRQTCLDAYAYQDVPFEKLVEELQIERNLNQNPLFQVMFVLQNAPLDELNLGQLTLTPLDIKTEGAKFDLTLSVAETERGLVGVWEYNSDLFHQDTIERLSGHFLNLLGAILEHPNQRIANLPILTEVEKQQILIEWNQTQVEYPQDQYIHQLFEGQVEKTPDAVAVVYQDQQLTYRQLNEKANQLAHYLQSLGVQPETKIGIYLERSFNFLISILGVFKVGGVYIPLDPNYPSERLTYILSDAQVSILITQEKFLSGLPNHTVPIICQDRANSLIERQNLQNLQVDVHLDHLAYIIYTSGSTGTPKGVLVEQRALLNLVYWHQNTFRVTATEKVTQLATTAFDASVWELWPYLTSGGCIYLVDSELLNSPMELQRWLIRQEISITFIPTPLAEILLQLEWPETIALRLMLIGGDQLRQYPPSSLPFQIINNYGPTENTVVTTSGIVEARTTKSSTPTIGKAIANTQVYILDPYLQPVPIGVPGELHIGGVQLARGYLNRSELTAEKFIPNPFNPQTRLYLTGDLGRYMRDGNIEFLGRIDNQVKIRGFRIELGEIEATLTQHPQIRETVVIARDTSSEDKQLVAYLVSDEVISNSQIRQFLQTKLPAHMIPGAFAFLETLPLTSNGKIDRKALPDPIRTSLSDFVAPRDILERQLSRIWSELLGVDPIGIRDNFFELGGHSLLAVRLMSAIKQQFQQDLPLATLFQCPNIEQLVSYIRQESASLLNSSLVLIQPQGSKTPLFFVHPAGGMVLCYFDLAQQLGTERPFYGLQATNLEKMDRVEDMATYYLEAIQTMQPQGPYLLGGWSFGGLVAYEMARQLQQQGQVTSFLGLVDTHLPTSVPLELDNPLDVLADLLNIEFPVTDMDISSLNYEEQLLYALRIAKEADLIPDDFDLKQVQFYWQVNQSNIQALNNYQPKPYSGKVTWVRAKDNKSEDQASDLAEWSKLAVGGLEIHLVPGTHRTIVLPPFVHYLASCLKQCLEQIDGG